MKTASEQLENVWPELVERLRVDTPIAYEATRLGFIAKRSSW